MRVKRSCLLRKKNLMILMYMYDDITLIIYFLQGERFGLNLGHH